MTLVPVVIAGGCGLPRNRKLRARLKPHLDADPELLASLLVHLELVRDDRATDSARPQDPVPAAAARPCRPDHGHD